MVCKCNSVIYITIYCIYYFTQIWFVADSPHKNNNQRSESQFFLSFFFFYWFDREKKSTSRGSSQQREKQAPRWARSLMWGWIPGPWDHDSSRRQMPNRLSHPGTPWVTIFTITWFGLKLHIKMNVGKNLMFLWILVSWNMRFWCLFMIGI